MRAFAISLAIFLVLDALWLGFISKSFYASRIGHILADRVNWNAAAAFYLIFIGGLNYFAIAPALAQGSLRQALTSAAMYGLVTYATYDLTNHATVRGLPLSVTLVDLAWGVVICTAVSAGTYWLCARS